MKSPATRAAASAPPAPQSAASRLADRSGVRACRASNEAATAMRNRGVSLLCLAAAVGGIANEVVELPTELGAGSPFGRAEGGDQKQDYNKPAANFCAGTKPRFQFGAHRNDRPPQRSKVIRTLSRWVGKRQNLVTRQDNGQKAKDIRRSSSVPTAGAAYNKHQVK